MFSPLKAFATALALLATLVSAAIAGLAAQAIAWYFQTKDYRAKVYQSDHESPFGDKGPPDTDTYTTTYNVRVFYNWIWFHPRITLISTNCLLAAGVLGAVLGTAIIVLSYSRTQRSFAVPLPRKKTWKVGPASSSFILMLDVLLFASVLIFTCASWKGYIDNLRYFGSYDKFYMPQHTVNHTVDLSLKDFGRSGKYTWEAWNCQLSTTLLDPPGEKVVSSHQAWLSCRLQEAMRYAIMGLLGLVTFRLALSGLMWWRDRVSARCDEEGSETESGMAKTKNFEESASSSASLRSMDADSIKEAHPASLYEMPAHRMSRVEMEDAHYREMEGDGAGKELAGEEVAVEAPNSETRQNSITKEG